MSFKETLKENNANRIKYKGDLARSLIKSSEEAILTAHSIKITDSTLKSIFRELYEAFRQYCEAIGYMRGYELINHNVITLFLSDVLKERTISSRFETYTKIRKGINSGNHLGRKTVEGALREVPRITSHLRKYMYP